MKHELLLSLSRWCQLMAGVTNHPGVFFDSLTPYWWYAQHDEFNQSIIANRSEKHEFIPSLGWVSTPPF